MKVVYLCLLFLLVSSRIGGAEQHADGTTGPAEEVNVSPLCAAVLVAAGAGTLAGLASAFTPALCSVGFCATGVAGNSFAAWWQSTIGLVAPGSLFATLQSVAMGGTSYTFAAGAFGGALGAQFVHDLCTYVDSAAPESPLERGLSATRASVIAFSEADVRCAASPTCTLMTETASSVANTVSSTWNRLKASAWDKATEIGLELEILNLKRKIANEKEKCGVKIFDIILQRECLTKIDALEVNVPKKKVQLVEIGLDLEISIFELKRLIADEKEKCGVQIFDMILERECLTKINALEVYLREKEMQLADDKL